MEKYLFARGNGWILTINKNFIKLIGANPETSELLFKIQNKTLYIRVINSFDPEYSSGLVRKFNKQNSSWGLYFSNSILQILDINPGMNKVKIEIDDNIMIIKKAK